MYQPHLDRGRAESFGSVAALYDRYRPSYSDALIDHLAALRPAQVVDVGCGTGQVATALASRGLSVLGVEPDEQMAPVARSHGIPVEVAAFETWDDAGRQFELITCGAAWHWIDPALGIRKAARVLRRGGTLARFWNYEVPDEPAASALESVYSRLAPEATRYVPSPPGVLVGPAGRQRRVLLARDQDLRVEPHPEHRGVGGMVTTFSDHLRLGPERLTALQRALTDAIATLGGTIHARCGTYVRLARRA